MIEHEDELENELAPIDFIIKYPSMCHDKLKGFTWGDNMYVVFHNNQWNFYRNNVNQGKIEVYPNGWYYPKSKTSYVDKAWKWIVYDPNL